MIEITPHFNALLDRLETQRWECCVKCLYVFPTRTDTAYTASGFKTLPH